MELVVIPGEGIGPEIMDCTLKVLDEVKAPFDKYHFVTAGKKALDETGESLPEDVLALTRKVGLALKSPLETPPEYVSVNVRLRKGLDLYQNVRPARSYRKDWHFHDVDLVLFRENVEGLYSGDEWWEEVDGNPHGIGHLHASNSWAGMERFLRKTYAAAREMGRKRVTLVHKANIMKVLSGIFVEVGMRVAAEYPDIETNTMIADDCGQKLVMRPQRFDVIATTNLFGDFISDVSAGTVGGLGFAPGANVGDDAAVFEAVHGTAPDIAGQGVANPSALVLSAAMLLDHVGCGDKAERVRSAVRSTVDAGLRTPDAGGKLTSAQYTDALVERLRG